MRKHYPLVAGISISFIGVLATFLTTDNIINQILPVPKDKIVASWILVCVFVGVAAWTLVLIVDFVLKRATRAFRSRITIYRSFEIAECSDDHIREISRIGLQNFGGSSTDELETMRLHSIDPFMFHVLLDKKENIRGYFCIIRLTAAGVAAVMRNEFFLAHIPREYIRIDKKRFYQNVYVGAVLGDSLLARSHALVAANIALQQMRPTSVYARAATKDGLRLLRKHGFHCLHSGEGGLGDLFCRKVIPR